MTKDQLATIHIAAREVGLVDRFGDKTGYRFLLKWCADVESSKELTNETLEDVMAVMEGMGFDRFVKGIDVDAKFIQRVESLCQGKRLCLPELCEKATNGRQIVVQDMRPCEAARLLKLIDGQEIAFPTYWQDKVARRNRFANARMVRKIYTLAAEQKYAPGAMCYRMSNHRTEEVEQLTPVEAYNVIEALKKIIDRDCVQQSAAAPRNSIPAGMIAGTGEDDLPF